MLTNTLKAALVSMSYYIYEKKNYCFLEAGFNFIGLEVNCYPDGLDFKGPENYPKSKISLSVRMQNMQ